MCKRFHLHCCSSSLSVTLTKFGEIFFMPSWSISRLLILMSQSIWCEFHVLFDIPSRHHCRREGAARGNLCSSPSFLFLIFRDRHSNLQHGIPSCRCCPISLPRHSFSSLDRAFGHARLRRHHLVCGAPCPDDQVHVREFPKCRGHKARSATSLFHYSFLQFAATPFCPTRQSVGQARLKRYLRVCGPLRTMNFMPGLKNERGPGGDTPLDDPCTSDFFLTRRWIICTRRSFPSRHSSTHGNGRHVLSLPLPEPADPRPPSKVRSLPWDPNPKPLNPKP
jgi:hypothetical protein